MDVFIPLVLLSLSFIVLLGWEVSRASTERSQLENAITQRQPQVDQAVHVQSDVFKLCSDLLQAAQTDGTAKAIADKFGIKVNGNNAPTVPPAGK